MYLLYRFVVAMQRASVERRFTQRSVVKCGFSPEAVKAGAFEHLLGVVNWHQFVFFLRRVLNVLLEL